MDVFCHDSQTGHLLSYPAEQNIHTFILYKNKKWPAKKAKRAVPLKKGGRYILHNYCEIGNVKKFVVDLKQACVLQWKIL